MTEQRRELDEIVIKLECIISMFYIVRENYFGNTDPNLSRLVAGYVHYTNTFDMIHEMLIQQKKGLDRISDEMYELDEKLEELLER